MRDEMSKTMSCCLAATGLFACLALSFGTTPANAFGASGALTQALTTDVVLAQTPEQIARAKRQGRKVARRAGAQSKKINISQEHKDQIKQNIPAEYHQYLPKEITGGGAPGR
jgi:hypothetical protein